MTKASQEKRITLTCESPKCRKKFQRAEWAISPHNYCSRSCAVTVNNTKFPKNPGVRRACPVCSVTFVSREKYCSAVCSHKGSRMNPDTIIKDIQNFCRGHGRIPLKTESRHYSAARKAFGSWNKAIEAAGFEPNPVMFSKKYVAHDGHLCDSFAETVVDDWLHENNLPHQRNIRYPEKSNYTVDFVVGNYWIEYFGLDGQHNRYDLSKKEKLLLAEKYKIRLIEILPHHVASREGLDKKLEPIVQPRSGSSILPSPTFRQAQSLRLQRLKKSPEFIEGQ